LKVAVVYCPFVPCGAPRASAGPGVTMPRLSSLDPQMHGVLRMERTGNTNHGHFQRGLSFAAIQTQRPADEVAPIARVRRRRRRTHLDRLRPSAVPDRSAAARRIALANGRVDGRGGDSARVHQRDPDRHAFTVAHSLTLALATLEVVRLPSRGVESAIAVSVLVAALNNVLAFFHGRSWAGGVRVRADSWIWFRHGAGGLGLAQAHWRWRWSVSISAWNSDKLPSSGSCCRWRIDFGTRPLTSGSCFAAVRHSSRSLRLFGCWNEHSDSKCSLSDWRLCREITQPPFAIRPGRPSGVARHALPAGLREAVANLSPPGEAFGQSHGLEHWPWPCSRSPGTPASGVESLTQPPPAWT